MEHQLRIFERIGSNISEIEPRISAIIKSGQLEHLTATQQRALNTFVDTIDGKKRHRYKIAVIESRRL